MSSATAAYQQWCTVWSDIQLHLPVLYDAGRGVVLELGVRAGVSTAALLAGVEAHGGTVWSVDCNPDCAGVFAGHPQWRFVCADSCDSQAIRAAGLPATLDTLFVDTEHTYERTLAELDLWGAAVRPGGLILLHDAATDLYPGVPAAMHDYAARHGLAYEIRPGSYGLGIIQVPA